MGLLAGQPGGRIRPLPYLMAAAASTAAILVSWLLAPVLEPSGLPLLLAAVMLSAWYGGLGPGVAATVLGALGGTSAFMPLAGGSPGLSGAEVARVGVFVLEGVVITALSAALRRARARAESLFAVEQAARTEIEEAVRAIHDVQGVTDAALAHLDLDDLLRALLRRIREILQTDTVVFLLLDERGSELIVRAAHGLEEEVAQDLRIPMGRGIAGRIAARQRPMVFEDPGAVEIWSPVLRAKGLRSILGVPLTVEGRVIGVVHVGTLRPRRFTGDDIRLLRLVADRIAVAIERARLYEAERAARAAAESAERRSRRLVEQVISAQEDQQRHVARDLHDGTGQSLTSLLVGLRAIDEAATLDAARGQAREVRRVAARALDEVHRLARGLRSSVLDDLGLGPALEQCAAEMATAHDMTVDVESRGLDGSRLPAAVETALYRIVQEALANAAKHAKAQTVSVVVRRIEEQVQAIVADDGLGFDVEAALRAPSTWTHLGLHGMRERAALLDGTLTIESTPGEGTTVYVWIPLPGGWDGEDSRPRGG